LFANTPSDIEKINEKKSITEGYRIKVINQTYSSKIDLNIIDLIYLSISYKKQHDEGYFYFIIRPWIHDVQL